MPGVPPSRERASARPPLRAIAQVCVGVSAALCTVFAVGQSTQTTPPPTVSSSTSSQETPPPRPAPIPLTPEQQALQNANRIQDPVQKLDALRKLQSELSASVAVMVRRQVDDAVLWHLVAQEEHADMSNREKDPLALACAPDGPQRPAVQVLSPREVQLGGPRAM